jgi:hypothetical protein
MSDTAGSRNGGIVDQLLLESELDDDGGLRPVLLELRALAGDQPEPSAAVAALMSPALKRPALLTAVTPAAGQREAAGPASQPAPAAAGAVTDELAARRRAKRRITLTSLSVAVSLAAGGAVAAASDQGIRDTIGQLNHAVTSFVTTGNGGPANPPAETPVQVPNAPGGSGSVPAPTAPVLPEPAATTPVPGTTHRPHDLPVPASPAVPLPELPVPDHVAPGVPGLPATGEEHPTVPPLPATPPVQVPGVQSQ